MRKTIKLLTTLLLVTLLTCVFVACGEVVADPIDDVPPPTIVGGNGGSGDGGSGDGGSGDGEGDGGDVVVGPVDPTTGKPVYLTFSYLTQAPSVFKHIYIDEFDLANIEYHVTYECIVNGKKQYLAGEGKPLSMDMLTKESKSKLQNFGKNGELSGHFFLFVEHDVEYTDADGSTKTKTVSGSFAVHLKTKDALIKFVDLTFDLDGGYALFGNNKDGKAHIKVEDGLSYTWTEFITAFPVYKQGYAMNSVTVGGKTYNASSTDTITIKGDTSFKIGWTENVMPITFDINLPDGVTSWAPVDSSLLTNFNEANGTWSLSVEKSEGFIPRPAVSNIATLDGYTFAGWRKADGTVWNFNKRAGDEAFTLYAMWTIRTYSVKFVLMGGEFDGGKSYSNTATTDLNRLNLNVNYALGLAPGDPGYDPDSTRDNLAFKPFIVTFEGIPYGSSLADFYGVCNLRSDVTDLVNISADPAILATQIKKSDGCYEVDGWYGDPSYKDGTEYAPATVTEDLVLYPKWKLKDTLGAQELNEYFASKLFTYTEKSDGTLRIDQIIDTSVSELIIPASVFIGGKEYRITEIGEGAIMNIKTLITVDLTGASNLTRIDRNAFAYCPNLREIKISDSGSAVNYIGESAFRGTEFINSYRQTYGKDYAVIGTVLAQYVGDVNATTLMVDVEGVTTIAPSAFSGLSALESVTIGDNVKYIYEKAFYKNTNLITVNGGDGLEFVAADAFDQTAYVTSRPADDTSTPVDESQYLRIGHIYYRYVGTGKSATIPAGITIIAPNAFSTGHLIETIAFEDADEIKSIGADAFVNTKWINENHTSAETGHATTFVKDGFVVVNGILIAKRGRDAVVEIPSEVVTIATGAFDNQYITNVTVPADSNLALIETDAFNGATNLMALSFINATDSVFALFNDGAFSDANGEVINDNFKIYFYEAPLAALASAINESDSPALKAWKTLYSGASEMFEVLVTKTARFNSEVEIPTQYLYNGMAVNFTEVWDSLGLLNSAKTHIIDGAIVVRSDNVERVEDLAISSISNLNGNVGTGRTMTFSVDGVTSAGLDYNVYAGIKESTMTIWHEADGIEVEGLPTFYTTQSNFNEEGYVIKIKYELLDSTVGEMLLTDERVTVTGYTPVYGVNKALQIDVDYYGIASYRVVGEYSVKKPQSISVEQCSSMSISVNATVAEINVAAREVVLKVVATDGTFKYVNMASKSTFISLADAANKNATADEVALDTTTLGYHTVGLRYGAPGEYVYCNIIYSVTLNTDASMFNYAIVGENEAIITGVKSGYDTTIAVPARARLTDNGVYNPDSKKEYTIVGIGDGAFKDEADVEYVYIPASVKSIGNEAFMGCTSLRQIRSFTVVEAGESTIAPTSITYSEYNVKYMGEVTVVALADQGRKTVRVPATVTYDKVVEATETTPYNQNLTYVLDVKLNADVFGAYNGNIELPDTDYYRAYAEANLAGKNVTFYTTGSGDKADNFVFANYLNPVITYAYMTGNATIERRANITVVEGVAVIPERLQAKVSVDESNYGYAYEYDYAITKVDKEAFAKAFSDGLVTIYLPNSLSAYAGDINNLFGEGNYNLVTQFVYDVREDAIYAPSNTFPQYVETIGNKAFYGCTSLGAVPAGVDRTSALFDYADYGIDFGNATALKHIGSYAFYGCTGIEEIDLTATQITAVNASTFSGCTALRTMALPTTVTEIGDLAYDGCTSLTTVTGTDNVKYVCAYAFHNCTSLENITIPASAQVADTAFDGAKING